MNSFQLTSVSKLKDVMQHTANTMLECVVVEHARGAVCAGVHIFCTCFLGVFNSAEEFHTDMKARKYNHNISIKICKADEIDGSIF